VNRSYIARMTAAPDHYPSTWNSSRMQTQQMADDYITTMQQTSQCTGTVEVVNQYPELFIHCGEITSIRSKCPQCAKPMRIGDAMAAP